MWWIRITDRLLQSKLQAAILHYFTTFCLSVSEMWPKADPQVWAWPEQSSACFIRQVNQSFMVPWRFRFTYRFLYGHHNRRIVFTNYRAAPSCMLLDADDVCIGRMLTGGRWVGIGKGVTAGSPGMREVLQSRGWKIFVDFNTRVLELCSFLMDQQQHEQDWPADRCIRYLFAVSTDNSFLFVTLA